MSADRDKLQLQLEEAQSANQRWREAFKELEGERDNLEWQVRVHCEEKQSLRQELEEVRSSASPDPEQQPAPAIELPEPADLLNQLKGRRKKSKAELADVTEILEILEGESNQ